MSIKPKCVIITGRPGAGKTTLAALLGAGLRLPVVSRDGIKEGYVAAQGRGHDALPPDTNAVVTDLFFALVNQYLAASISLIVEAAFQHQVWAPRLPALQSLSSPCFVICTLNPDAGDRRQRQRPRQDRRWEYFHGTPPPPGRYIAPELPVPTIAVRTDADYAPDIDAVVRWIESTV